MNPIKKTLFIALFLIASAATFAQTHWTCNPSDYQYDMSVYATVALDGKQLDPQAVELAAFVGDECRGVAEAQETQGKKYYYLRVRSNSAANEEITFKVYGEDGEHVVCAAEAVTFESQKLVGMPSSPLQLTVSNVTPGDANGDGGVDDQDLMLIVNYLIGITSDKFQFAGADYNGDGEVDDQDLMKIVNVLIGAN